MLQMLVGGLLLAATQSRYVISSGAWQLNHPCYHSSFQGHHERIGILFQRKDHLCHALPLQTFTTGNDSEARPSQSLTSECEGKVGADRADVLVRFQQSLETLNKVYQETKRSRWAIYGMNAWERTPPWIKLPTMIFLPWFLFISAFYGLSVSMDLLPLWIIGPLVVGLLVKVNMKMSAACQRWLAEKKLKETALLAIEGARTGLLFEVAGTKIGEARLHIMEKTWKGVYFIRSGRFICVFKQYLHRKLIEQQERWIEKFQDWRLVYLRWERTLKNII
ncbi:hypothetical protein GOP47_0014593 [Adiantum capillus-veneris]|uniref:Uncharacterized protein n=1 Tax=Adiantum capillus-veneris TaxID=13818 RepID=A0A9D4ULZ3_ADICA|nr:hypothetical protein GOP47_0014593 [Adiantum capillus-veneris]